MRKRRVILFDDDYFVLDMMKLFFEAREYEVVACQEPVPCPVYDGQQGCGDLPPCGDIMIADYRMPGMSGIELLQMQAQRGCKLTIKNKAIMSGHMDEAAMAAVDAMGCRRFDKPFLLEELEQWLAEREGHMDLTVPLKVKRKDLRQYCSADATVLLKPNGGPGRAQAVNWSNSGLCVMVPQPLAVGQTLDVSVDSLFLSVRHQVRWTRPAGEQGYLAGMSRC